MKLPIPSAKRQLNFTLDSEVGGKESPAGQKGHKTTQARKKGAAIATPFSINNLRYQPSALTRADRREIFREAVFL